jgi:hypothetical protein
MALFSRNRALRAVNEEILSIVRKPLKETGKE